MLEGTQLCFFTLKCVCGHADPEFNYSPLPFGCTDSVCLHSIPQLKPQMLTTHSPERCFPFSVLNQSPTSFLKHPQWQCFTGSDRQPSSSFTSCHILLLYHSLRSRSCFSHSLLSNLWLQLQLPFLPSPPLFSVPSLTPSHPSWNVVLPILLLMMPRALLAFLAAVVQKVSDFGK